MSLSPEEQSKLRKEATEQVYRDAFKDNIVAKNKYFVHIISSNCEGYVAGQDQNGLSFHFPVLPQGHMKNCRVKVIHSTLPRYSNLLNVESGAIEIQNLIRDRTFIPIQQDGYTEALQGQTFPVATNFTTKQIINSPSYFDTPLPSGAATEGAYRVLNTGVIQHAAGGANVVGALAKQTIVGYEVIPDDEFRWCDNPSGKKITIKFKNSGFGDINISRDDNDYPWTLSLLFEFLPDFNSNDRLTN